jgi:uncharacterized protein YkwD
MGALLGVFLLGTSTAYAWATDSFSTTDENTIVTLTNQARASAGVAALSVDSVLHTIAEDRAKYMYVNNCLTHNSCTGGTSPMYIALINSMGYCLSSTANPNAGENIGWNNYPDDQSAQVMFNGWMNSSSHKGNILQSTFTRIGVGAYKGDGRYGTMADRGYGGQADTTSLPAHIYVQVFAHPCSTSPTPTPKPTPTPTPKPTPTPTPKPTPTPTPRPTATPTPHPTATPTPRPTPTSGGTPNPTAPGSTPVPDVTPAPSPSIDVTASPDASLDHGLDPIGLSAGGWAAWTAWDSQPAPTAEATVEPTVDATTAPTLPPGVIADGGLAVKEPTPELNLLDTIVGDVVSSYLGQ